MSEGSDSEGMEDDISDARKKQRMRKGGNSEVKEVKQTGCSRKKA